MHVWWLRANSVVFYGLTVLFGLSCMAAVTTLFHTPTPEVSLLQLNGIQAFRQLGGADAAVLQFDLDADLSSEFNWNVKQLFVYLTAEFATDAKPRNQVVLWDRIVRSEEDAHISLRGERVEYPLRDQGRGLKSADVKLSLHWDVMPYTGLLALQHHSEPVSFRMPQDYLP